MPALLSFSEVQTTLKCYAFYTAPRARATGSVRTSGRKVMRMRTAPSAREEDPTLAYRYCIPFVYRRGAPKVSAESQSWGLERSKTVNKL